MAGRTDLTPLMFIGGPLDGRRIIPAGWQHTVAIRQPLDLRQTYFADKPVEMEPNPVTYWTYYLRDWFGVRFMSEESLTQAQITRALISNYRPSEE